MGKFIETRCHDCERQFTLKLGVGMMYWPLEAVIRHTRGNVRRRLQEIVENFDVVSSQYGHRLFACPACDTLHGRFYVRVDYENRKFRSETFETEFLCGKCRTPLIEPTKPVSAYRCSECGSYGLENRSVRGWD
jgi:DNA-directed RNA polymerase subunit RPC12/RpoP